MKSLEDASSLLFELSNVTRLEVLTSIENEPRKLSAISKLLDIAIQETSRHLARLVKAKLAKKDAGGFYSLTPLGKQMCFMLPTIRFLATNADYFVTHSMDKLPNHFKSQVGVLIDSEVSPHVMESFKQTENLLRSAEQYIWIMADQVLSSSLPLIDEAISKGLEFRIILPECIQDMEEDSIEFEHLGKISQPLRVERCLEDVDVILILSEKGALITFPTVEGKNDYLGFSVSNDTAHDWCKDLFLHFWESAKSR